MWYILSRLKVNTFGNLDIFLDNKSIKENLSYKGIALLAYLAVNKGKSFNRDKLAYMFWDSSSSNAARYNLRYTLWSLRKAIKDNKNETKFIISHKDDCQLNPNSHISVDVLELEELIDGIEKSNDKEYLSSLERIKNIYKGEFLEGFYVKGCIEFNDWFFYERERIQRRYFQSLNKLSAIYKAQEKYFKSIEVYEEMLKINPLQEQLYVELMKIYFKLGHRKSALKQYERCCKVLREELNISPMETTKEVYKQILSSNRPPGNRDDGTIEHNALKKGVLNKKLCLDCYPINDIPYYFVSKMVEKLIDAWDRLVLKDIPTYYWKDIFRIQPKVAEFIGEINCYDNLTDKTEKNRIFIALGELLYEIAKDKSFLVEIRNFQWIDNISFDFIKYFLFLYPKANIKIIIYYDKTIEDNKIDQLIKYYKTNKENFKKLDIIEL